MLKIVCFSLIMIIVATDHIRRVFGDNLREYYQYCSIPFKCHLISIQIILWNF